MPHEPSRSRPPLQPADRRCPSCRAVKPPEDFPDRAGTAAGGCGFCRRRRTAVTRRHRQHTLRRVLRRAEAGYRALLARHGGGGGGGAA
jgi:hypothetical protein